MGICLFSIAIDGGSLLFALSVNPKICNTLAKTSPFIKSMKLEKERIINVGYEAPLEPILFNNNIAEACVSYSPKKPSLHQINAI